MPLFTIVRDETGSIRDLFAGMAGFYAIEDLPDRIAANIMVDPVSGCWVWTGRTDRDGYGRYGSRGAHRVVFEALAGPVPRGLVLDHRDDLGCTTRACCWPAHLRPVTTRENTLRGRSFAAVNAAKEACVNGHPFDQAGTYWRPNGHRDCRPCTAARQRQYKARLRARLRQEQHAAPLRRAA